MLVGDKDVRFKAVRASGAGGQRTNRRSTKVQLWVTIDDLPLTKIEKKRLRKVLKNHINHLDELFVENEEERSQEANRGKALEKMNGLIKEALKVPKKRFPTEPTRSSKEARIQGKKKKSEKKKSRRLKI